MPLAVGDVLTLTLTARDTAGNAAQATPLRVLIAPHAMGLRPMERIGETGAAGQWADALATDLEAAVKALEDASGEGTPTVGGMPGSGGSQSSGAAGRVNRRLASAIEAGAAVRRRPAPGDRPRGPAAVLGRDRRVGGCGPVDFILRAVRFPRRPGLVHRPRRRRGSAPPKPAAGGATCAPI